MFINYHAILSDQGKVWRHVAEMSHAMDAPTATGAMHDVYEQKRTSFEEFGRKIRPVKGQAGAGGVTRNIDEISNMWYMCDIM